jgi:hypothetical protein
MWKRLHVKCRHSRQILMEIWISLHIFRKKNTEMLNFMKIRTLGAELFHAERRTDKQTDRQTDRHDDTNSCLSQILRTRLQFWTNKWNELISTGRYLPTNHGLRRLPSTVRFRKYSSKPLTGLACGCTDKVPSTSASFPSDTRLRALQPSDPIHEKAPVALFRRTARMTPATSWSEPKIMAPGKKV